jgi:hypothetical protein
MKLKPGSRLRSQVDATEVIVVRAPADDIEVTCGGHPMIDVHDEPAPGLTPVDSSGGDAAVEFLVTTPGGYGLSVAGEPLVLKEAKPLPASD